MCKTTFGLLDCGKYFEATLVDGKTYMFDMGRRCIVKTTQRSYHGDIKTELVHPRGSIPSDTEVEVIGHFFNFYGHYLTVKYLDTTYDLPCNTLEYVRIDN